MDSSSINDTDTTSTDKLLDDNSSVDILEKAKSFAVESTASYGSINSVNFENSKPNTMPGLAFESSVGFNRHLRKIFLRRIDSLDQPRFVENEHLITRCEKTNLQLVLFSLKHSFQIFLVTLPTILVSCAFVIGYSYVPWTNTDCKNLTDTCSHYKPENLIYFNTFLKMVLLSIICVLIGTIALDGNRHLFRTILYITIPLVTISTASIPGLLKYSTLVYYYYLDILVCSLVFLFGLAFTILLLSRHLEIQVTRRRLLQVFLLPSVIAVLGLGFLDAVVNKEYQKLSKGSIGQYVIRLVVYPIICDIILAIIETNAQKIPTNQINNPSHVVFFYQVALSIIGRYMTTISGSTMGIFIMAATVAAKDFLFHRMSRLRCWIAFHVRTCWRKTCTSCADAIDYDTFEEWFFSKDFTYFKAHTLNNDFFIELTGVVVIPVVLATFNKHTLLYYFNDTSFLTVDGSLDYIYIIKQGAIQIAVLYLSVVMVTFIEARYNRVNLSAVTPKTNLDQYISQILIYVWGVILFLSSVKTTPNYFQCTRMDICSCSMEISLNEFGC